MSICPWIDHRAYGTGRSVASASATPPGRSQNHVRASDAIDRIEELREQSGGFGCFLLMGHEWARPDVTRESLRLFAEEVIPHFTGSTRAPIASHVWFDGRARELAASNARPFVGACVTQGAGNPQAAEG